MKYLAPGRRLEHPLATLCCKTVLAKGTAVEIIDRPSPNRLMLRLPESDGRQMHKVKRSKFNTAVTA